MKKLAALMLASLTLLPVAVDSTELEGQLPQAQQEMQADTPTNQLLYFTSIPAKPHLKSTTFTYKDMDLSQVATQLSKDTSLAIKQVLPNHQGVMVFELADGTYLEASRQLVFDDVILNQETLNETSWLKDKAVMYEAPYTNGVKEKQTDLRAGDQVHLIAKAQTNYGTYYQVEGAGWLAEASLSSADTRMLKVQAMLTQKYNKANYSIYVKQLDTQAIAGINMDKSVYSASIAKLATLYLTQDRINSGAVSLSDNYSYKDTVNHFMGAYDPSGSGHLPKKADNKSYSVDDLLKATAQHSDNVAANMLGYYVANQFDNAFYSKLRGVMGQDWNMKDRQFSAHSAGNLMEAIYYQQGTITDYLSQTDFDKDRISKNIPVKVAHKIGDAYDYKHDVAIVYADQPFILSIFTDKASYDDISKIADDVYAILK